MVSNGKISTLFAKITIQTFKVSIQVTNGISKQAEAVNKQENHNSIGCWTAPFKKTSISKCWLVKPAV